MKSFFTTSILALITWFAFAQKSDTTVAVQLHPVAVTGYYNPQLLLRAVGAVSVVDSNILKNQPSQSLVSALNTVAGVRMEERSPGSYRLSLRGSLLRSPFGIRNIKIYIDDFPLTDAGGNTYLNLLDVAAIGRMEIYKGPEASSFGATTGGTVLISPTVENNNSLSANLTAGSYGLFQQTVKLQQVFNNYRFNAVQGYQESDGYREHSALKRIYFQTFHQLNYARKGYLKAFLFYSALDYQTPGGLTAAQLSIDPKAARPTSPTLPGAVNQQAGIFNRTIFGGLSNTFQISTTFKHVVAVFGSTTQFRNPFITNYEKRKESSFGVRTFLNYNISQGKNSGNMQLGIETSRTNIEIENFTNAGGTPSTLQAADDLQANQSFAFVRLNFDLSDQFLLEFGTSLNFFNYQYESSFPSPSARQRQNFDPRLMPKLALSYLIRDWLSFRTSISKGYSAPTLAEVRSSDQLINTNLQAEHGWNYEVGIRIKPQNSRLYTDVNLFYFKLEDAIVRRINTSDVEYFINAGGTKQLGTEVQLSYWLIKRDHSRFLKGLQLSSGYTYSHFKFDNFSNAAQNYTGNQLAGVPKHTVVSSFELALTSKYYLFGQHNFTSSIPLNDANTVYASKYHIVDLKAGVRDLKLGKKRIAVSAGINNLFDQQYSLGNDLNAANNRYYNPATGFNCYMSLVVKLF